MDTQSKFNAEKYDLEGEWKCAFRPDVDHYRRIGLDPERQYSTQQIDEAYQARVNWWKARKKQRDKGEESNPLIKKVGPYIDDALNHLGQVSACLLDAEKKRAYDKSLEQSRNRDKEAKLLGFIAFTLRDGLLTTTEKRDLLEQARELGVTRQRAEQMIWAEMARCGAREVSDEEVLRKSDAAQGGSRPTAIIDPPQLVVSQAGFSLGTLRKGERRECVFATDNKGGGILQGNIEVSDPQWLKVSEAEITGRKHHQEIRVFVDTSSLNLGSSYTGRIDIHSNGGRAAVQIDLSVELEKVAVARYRTQLFWTGLLFGAALGVVVYGLISNTFTTDVVARIAGLVGCAGIIAVCAQARGWGGGIGVFFLAWISGKILELLSMRAYSAAAWATIASSFLYLCARPLLVAKLSGNSRTRGWVAAGGLGLSASVVLLGIEVAPTLNPRPYLSATMPVEDKMVGSTIGSPTGIRWTHVLGDRGAAFSATDSSRIEYPGLIPREGTLEFWIDVNGGYHYENGQFKANQSDAMLFSSDAQGGDVTWPGTTKLFVGRKGRVSFWMATNKYNQPSSPETEARNTKFRFGEWHAIGVSYGRQGQYIMLDGKLVASAPARTQTFGVAGNHQQPLDIPTIGETVSHFWSRHRYEGGFEGTLAAFRVSDKQGDWVLAKGVNISNEASGTSIGSSGPGTTAEGIRKVDFSNFDYPSDCWKYYANSGFDNSIHVTKGAWAKGKNPDTGLDVLYFGVVGKPVFGDLTASGQEEAVVQTSCGFTAGNGGTDEVFIFGMTEGKPQVLSKLSLLDWQTPNEIPFDVQKVEIQNGELLVTYRSGGNHAQPAGAATATFKWDGKEFLRTGLAHRSLAAEVPLSTVTPLLRTSEWEIRWEGKQREDPLEMRLKRQGSSLEGIVVHSSWNGKIAPLSDEVRGTLHPDGSFALVSEGHLQWRGKLSPDNRISGVFPNGVPDDSTLSVPLFPFTLMAAEALPTGTITTKTSDGAPTTSDWDVFLKAFRTAVEKRDKPSLRPFIAERFELENEGSERYYPPDRVLRRLDARGWTEIDHALASGIEDRPASAWGYAIKAAVDNSPCSGCKYQVWLGFEKDQANQWHWVAWDYPGD